MLSDTTMSFAESLTTGLLGLDALYVAERGRSPESSSIERLVVLNLSPDHQPDRFTDYDEASQRFAELSDVATTLPEPDRRRYYRQTCASAIAFATWRTRGLAFSDQIAQFLHLPARPAGDDELDRLRQRMRDLLTELGYSGDLASQCAAWEAKHRVPPKDVREVLTELLSTAWDETNARCEIPAAKSDGMRVETVSGVPYNAMCDFSRRLIRLNIDPTLTLPGLKHLAVHEGYPGHYVQFIRRQVGYRAGRTPADALLSVVNSASSAVFEGIADAGMNLIGWHTDLDDRLSALLTRYRSGLGTRAAWRLHAEGWLPERVRDELHRDALVGGEGWVDNRMRFISADDRAALIWSYWWGEPSVDAVWRTVRDTPEKVPDYIAYVYDRMHSIESIAMFALR